MQNNDIIANIREGNEQVISEVYQTYRKGFVYFMMKKYQRTEEDARELYQHAFMALYDNIRSGKLTAVSSSIKTYLYGIGKNKFREQKRRVARFEYHIDENIMIGDDETNEFPPEQEFQLKRVEKALNQLGHPCKQLLMMALYEGRSMEYIARKLGYKNADTAKTQKYKCGCRLRKLLNNEYGNR